MKKIFAILSVFFCISVTAYDVVGLKIFREGENTVAEIITTGPSSVKTAKLTSPDRLLIDLIGGVQRLKDSDLPPLPPGIVVEARSAQFQSDPPIVRIVFVLAEPIGEVQSIDGPRSGKVIIPTPGYPIFKEWSIGMATPAEKPIPEPVEPVKQTTETKPEEKTEEEQKPVQPPSRPPDPRRPQLEEEKLQRTYIAGDSTGEGTSYVRPLVIYRGKDYPDPFIVAKPVTEAQLGEESFPIVEDLKLVGIVGGKQSNKFAILQDARGWGYILAEGDSIRGGLVDEISDSTIIFDVEEFGVIRQVILTLPKEAFKK